MKTSSLLCLALAACSSATPHTTATAGAGQESGSSNGQSGGTNNPSSGSTAGTVSGASAGSPAASSGDVAGSGSVTSSGSTSATGGSGSTSATGGSGSTSATGGSGSGASTSGTGTGGTINAIPAGYTGTPFPVPTGHSMTIPGTIHLADYDYGGVGVEFCHSALMPPTATAMACGGFNFDDWRPAGTPIYRPAPAGDTKICNAAACDDNSGLCHMNNGEPDRDPAGNLIMPQDVYPCYTATGEWIKLTVTVTAAGTYSVGGLMGAPRPDQNATPTVMLDFGTVNGTDITTGVFTVPPSECDPNTGCTEGYHVWQTDNAMGMVTFPSAGTYVMTFNLVSSFLNADYFVFTKM